MSHETFELIWLVVAIMSVPLSYVYLYFYPKDKQIASWIFIGCCFLPMTLMALTMAVIVWPIILGVTKFGEYVSIKGTERLKNKG